MCIEHLHMLLAAQLRRIWSCAAVSAAADGDAASPAGSEQLIGFITAKSVFLHEVDAAVSSGSIPGCLAGAVVSCGVAARRWIQHQRGTQHTQSALCCLATAMFF